MLIQLILSYHTLFFCKWFGGIYRPNILFFEQILEEQTKIGWQFCLSIRLHFTYIILYDYHVGQVYSFLLSSVEPGVGARSQSIVGAMSHKNPARLKIINVAQILLLYI